MSATSVPRSTSPINSPMPTVIQNRHSPNYMSPRSSPSLSFGSPALSQGSSWIPARPSSRGPTRGFQSTSPALSGRSLHHTHLPPPSSTQPLPSPPQNDHHFSNTRTAEYSSHSLRGRPLSPPASDGFLSPHNGAQDYRDKVALDPNLPSVWMTNAFGVRADDSEMSLPLPEHNDAPSPPTAFLEDILRAEDPQILHGIGPGYLDENGFAVRPMERDPYMRRSDRMTRSSRYEPYPTPAPTSYAPTPGPTPNRTRKKRHLTDPSEANFHCKKCGKYFSRIWNYNAHQETHDPNRPRPHMCPYEECGKSFVRRTDLTRHQQCVHAKDKRFRCELCNNMFARKDTLRRHEDDGCPKRVDIVSRVHKDKPLVWSSQALNIGYSTALPHRDEPHLSYDATSPYDPQLRSSTYQDPSTLPPLSDVLPMPKGNPVLW